MKILAVDTSCDESCVAILDTDTWTLLADVIHSHIKSMSSYGGIVPEIASREHLKALPLALAEALNAAKLELSDIDHFVATNRPGLIGALLVGVSYVKALAYAMKKPFSALDHMEAHLYSPALARTAGKEVPPFPWVALVVSGGHTELFHVEKFGDSKWLGGTRDDAAGEAFDKIGKLMGLPYPAGPVIDRLAREFRQKNEPASVEFPRAKVDGLDFSFSGLKTAVHLHLTKLENADQQKEEVAFASQEAIVDSLVSNLRRAHAEYPDARIVVTGGVACNGGLREKLPEAYFPSFRHCTDNAAMVAVLAALKAEVNALHPDPWTTTAKTHSPIIPA